MTKAAPLPKTYSGWLKSLPAEERWNATIMGGHMVAFWQVAICKGLLQEKMTVGQRLQTSEMLEKQQQEQGLSVDIIAMIQPAGKAENEIFLATAKAGIEKTYRGGALDLLMSVRLFDLLTAANPSVLDAVKRLSAQRRRGSASVAARYAVNSKHDLPPPERQPLPVNIHGRLSDPPQESRFARGTPGHPDGGFNVHTGR